MTFRGGNVKTNYVLMIGCMLGLLGPAAGTAQAQAPAVQANPTPGCTATPAQLQANKRVAMEFFRTAGEARVALADPSYKQHNPAFKKRAEQNKVSDYEEFKSTFLAQAGRGAAGRGQATGPQPPAGNPFEIVTAECDLVTVVHKNFRQDPTAEPGKFYEVFTFDTFRVRDGKLVEHWDGAVINPPAPAAAGAQR
jgi:predicted SnoaL-like aldol condensation-catalyzing enzyme